MDFDYQQIKDAEKLQREEVLRSLAVPQRTVVPSRNVAQHPSPSQIPPIKPRRSIKSRVKLQETSLSLTNMSLSGPLEPLSMSLRAHTLLWFEKSQLPRLHRPGQPLPSWLHGFVTRKEAEELLQDKVQGCFLLRLSESMIGFVLSYRGKDRCRHFIIQEEGGGEGSAGGRYLITGEESRHDSLQELVTYYTQNYVGLFEEVLTVPFVKGSEVSGDARSGDTEGYGGAVSGTASGDDTATVPSVPLALSRVTEDSGPTSKGTDEYAVVKKMLKKSYSLTDAGTSTKVQSLQVPDCIPVNPQHLSTAEEGANANGDAVDVPYARVNKPLRAVRNTPTRCVNIPTEDEAASSPLSSEPAEEQKYWEMVPMHTYEETHSLAHPTESHDQIDFCAVGRRQAAPGSAENSQQHLYSEVNLKGKEVQNQEQIPGRRAPDPPLRPPPRASNCPSRPGGKIQKMDGNTLPVPPLRSWVPINPASETQQSNPHNSIYEQIPAKSVSP